MIRVEEMRESLNIMYQAVNLLQYLKSKDIHTHFIDDNKLTPPSRAFMKYSMNH